VGVSAGNAISDTRIKEERRIIWRRSSWECNIFLGMRGKYLAAFWLEAQVLFDTSNVNF
jgi:hypothetical protein